MEIEVRGNVVVTSLTQEDLQDKKTMQALQEMMDAQAEAYNQEVLKISDELGVDDLWALDILYLRTRSRWTQELENKLVQMAKDGEQHPNMCDWP